MDRKRNARDRMGHHFLWFEGVVEDIKDPKGLGRVKVRILGDHTQDTKKIKTAQLFWCPVIMPVTTASMQGIGQAPIGLVPGSWVIGFYRDDYDKQQPMILGSFGGIPQDPPNKKTGFNDPSEVFPMKEKLGRPDTNYLSLGSDGDYPVYDQHDVHQTSKAEVQRGMPGCAETWDEPETEREPVYPYNRVWEGLYDPKVNKSKWGHVEEWDSTPQKERYFRWHKTSHNSLEIFPDGREVHKIYGDNFEIDLARKLVRIDGDYKVTVNGNVDEHVTGDKWSYIKGNQITFVDGDIITVSHQKSVTHADEGVIVKSPEHITGIADKDVTFCSNTQMVATAPSIRLLGSASASLGVGDVPTVDPGRVDPTGKYSFTPFSSVRLSTIGKNEGMTGEQGDMYDSIPEWESGTDGTFVDFFMATPDRCYVMSNLDVYKRIRTQIIDVSLITRTTILSTLKLAASGPFRGEVESLVLVPSEGTEGEPPESTSDSLESKAQHAGHTYAPVVIDVTPVQTAKIWKDEEPCKKEG